MSLRLGSPEVSINAAINDESGESYGAYLIDLREGVDEQLSINQHSEIQGPPSNCLSEGGASSRS
jgi:hypothetical protein